MAGGLITNFLSQGLAASRPAAPDAPTGTLSFYFASDTEVLSYYDWNDAAWQTLTAGISLEEAGVAVSGGPFTTLNFNSGATVVDATGGVADIDIAASGGGSAIFGNTIAGASTDVFTSGYAAGIPLLVPAGATINGAGIFVITSNTATWQVGLYDDTGGYGMNNRLAVSSTQTNMVRGPNAANFTTPWTNSGALPVLVWAAFATGTANIDIAKTGNGDIKYWNNGGVTLPNPASSQSYLSNGWCVFAYS